ncbi:MAG: YceI family protein [Acidimicrobiales bacterium]
MSSGEPELDHLPEDDAPRRRPRTRTVVLGVALLVAAGAGLYTWQQVKPVVESRKYASITYTVPKAPKLTAKPGETIYRIDPTRSSLTYEVQERFAGKSTSKATGVTNGIAGDLAIAEDDLAASRIGAILANVEQFHSDNNLRDARLRHQYLESAHHPVARFQLDRISGLDGTLAPGASKDFTVEGTATVKGKEVPVRFDATATLGDDGALKATATTKAKLSDFDAGPITIAGLVSTSDDVSLTLELTAWDPSKHTIPTTITGPDAKDAGDAPSFAKTVQPILEANCASCHNTGGMAGEHTPIDTAGDARAISDGIGTVTKLGYMPPWPASDVGVPLAHEMKLTKAEVAAIAKWSDAGGAIDVPADEPLRPTEQDPTIVPRKDKVMSRPGYLGDPELVNDYRCFVLDPKLTKPAYLTGYTFIADQVPELHHAQVFHISGQQRQSARALDGKDGQPGWPCYGGPRLRGKRPKEVPTRGFKMDAGWPGQSNLVAGWVPGQSPVVFPQGSGVYLEAGDALVLQMHYHYDGKATQDRSAIALQLDPGSTPRKVLRVINPLAPVEIPCPAKDASKPLCDRDASLADYQQRYPGTDDEGGLLALCGKDPEEMAKASDGVTASTSCDHVVPEDGTIVGVLGHEHTIGKSFRMTLDPDTPNAKVLLDIPDWSFDWQMNYALAKPIHVKAGQPLRIECSFDRTRDPLREPRWIMFAEGTEDEMCFGTYALIPDDQ